MIECPYCQDLEGFPIELDEGICDICGYTEDD